jgi:DNA-binding SARP family transcriptional activator/TolB-like protein/Flp pilus assembly protein TadD
MIRLRTLGALDLRGSEGQELRTVLAQPKRAALLVYLALAPPRGPHRRDTLLALFWPEQDTEHARNALSQAVHFLRRSLGGEALVASNGEGLGLGWTGFWCDAIAFEEALEGGRLSEALDLYRGDLLEGFHVADAPEFDRWLDAERARLAERYAKALETVAEEREAGGDYDGAIRLWRRLASRDLYNSRVALRLMRVLAAAGDPGGAIQHARVHEALLREELDVAPDPEIAAFVRLLQSVTSEEARPERLELPFSEPAFTVAGASNPPVSVPHQRRGLVAAGLILFLIAAGSALALRTGAREPPVPPIRSLAVLPLANLSGDSTEQFFADGMHDALITELARYPQLKVISRTSVMQYRGTKKPLPDIARELKVDAVIEGTLMRDGGRIRMNTQLVHGPTDRHLWAKRYERDLRDILVLQAELAEAIAREVRAAASPVASRRGRTEGPPDSAPNALYLRELYLRGLHAETNRSPIGVQTAKQYYRRAIERDSTFALGYAGLAGVYGMMAEYDYAPIGPALDTTEIMARRAVALDSLLPEARTALALALGNAGEFAAAEREFRKAIELGPNDARAHFWHSILLVAIGRGEEALREARRALELDPFGPNPQRGMVRYATWLVTGTRPHLKLPVAERRPILKVEPGDPWARAQDAYDYATEGQCAEADKAISIAQPLAPESLRMLAYVATVDWLCGKKARARALLERMKARPDVRDQGYRIALVHTAFGEKDSAFVWLQRTRWTLGQMSGLSADRRVDPLRSDPRFLQLLQRLGVR